MYVITYSCCDKSYLVLVKGIAGHKMLCRIIHNHKHLKYIQMCSKQFADDTVQLGTIHYLHRPT